MFVSAGRPSGLLGYTVPAFVCCFAGLSLLACAGSSAESTAGVVAELPRNPEPAATAAHPGAEPSLAEVENAAEHSSSYVREHYVKTEYRVPMRDGTTLFTSVYQPKDRSRNYAIMLHRTPYSVAPYGPGAMRGNLGPSEPLMRDGYIFVYQDVRGTFMSEGDFVNMTPHQSNKTQPSQFDESSDTYDTIEWLLANLDGHNGRVGMWGISYPGFYAAAGMIDAHPALKAVSPQAPIADWFFDDFHHHGAFFLPHAFNFLTVFGYEREGLKTDWGPRFDYKTPDGYQFYMDMGPLHNANDKYLKGEVKFWNELVAHPNYDEFWKRRNLLPHLHRVAPAVMTVAGWYDAEDLYGPFEIYKSIEEKNPNVFNMMVVGPWIHGGWARTEGDVLGNVQFGAKTSEYYREHIERRFFSHFLKDQGSGEFPEVYMFETGANRWREFDQWPPEHVDTRSLWLQEGGVLAFGDAPKATRGYDEYVSDPKKPVPYTEVVSQTMTREYMTDDQRFAGRRPDVLVYETEPLREDLTLAGPINANLWVSTSGTSSDWVVKLIDVFPNDTPDHESLRPGVRAGGYQMMVRSEVLRGRFRDSYERPKPFVPNRPAEINLELKDILHTFKKGHRVMIQVQSSWFPLVDVNPQTYVDNIFEARAGDFKTATQRVHRSKRYPSRIEVGVLTTRGRP